MLMGIFGLLALALFPATGAMIGWFALRRWSPGLAWLGGLALGIGPLSWFGWTIYRHEGGNGDPDPLVFFQLVAALAVAATLLTLLALHVAARRSA